MVADEAGLQLGGMLDHAGTVGSGVPERKFLLIFVAVWWASRLIHMSCSNRFY